MSFTLASRLLVSVLAASSALAQAPPSRPINPAVKEAVSYLLTADKLDKYAQASRAVTLLIAKDPAYRERMKPDPKDAPQSVDATVTWAKAHVPAYVNAVEKAGMPFREYIVFQACLVITTEAYKRPRYVASFHVRRENVAFVQANWLKIQAILAQQRSVPNAAPVPRGAG